MNRREAIQAMLDCFKVRRKCWEPESYIECGSNGLFTDQNGSHYTLDSCCTFEWEIYEEPKPKRKLYEHIYEGYKMGLGMVITRLTWDELGHADNCKLIETRIHWEEK